MASPRNNPIMWAAGLVLAVSLVFGGGGSPNPWSEMVVQFAAGAVLLWLLLARSIARSPARTPGTTPAVILRPARAKVSRSAMWLIAIVLVVPAVQLVPLPPALWQAMPGRAPEIAALDLAGMAQSWRPWSVSPHLTLAGLLALVPPVMLFALTCMLGLQGQKMLLAIIVATGLAAVLLGALQVASGGREFYLYSQVHTPWVTGFFANRNAAADFFLISGLAAAALLLPPRPIPGDPQAHTVTGPVIIGLVVMVAVLMLATVLTGSRTSIALILVALAAQAWLAIPLFRMVAGQNGWAPIARAVLIAAMVSAAIYVGLRGNAEIAVVASRFGATTDFRSELWADTWYAIRQFWPWGAGIGTFVPVFVAGERLEVVDATMPNRAHNDYLEFLLETGVIAPFILAAITLILSRAAWHHWRAAPDRRPLLVFAAGTLVLIALHSLVDYPLRNMALSAVAAVAAGLLVGQKTTKGSAAQQRACKGSD
nr:O-antigen ligase family protein [Allopontixanthobacter confluentis]